MAFIIIVAIIIYFILIAWTWKSLGEVEKNKKVIYILIGISIMYLLTVIVFYIAKAGITYESKEIQNNIQNVLVNLFTGINGIIAMPQIGKIFDKINEGEIEKNQIMRRILILFLIFMIFLIFETGYMKDTQVGILMVYDSMK